MKLSFRRAQSRGRHVMTKQKRISIQTVDVSVSSEDEDENDEDERLSRLTRLGSITFVHPTIKSIVL